MHVKVFFKYVHTISDSFPLFLSSIRAICNYSNIKTLLFFIANKRKHLPEHIHLNYINFIANMISMTKVLPLHFKFSTFHNFSIKDVYTKTGRKLIQLQILKKKRTTVL
ncbi:unnamed protein product [Musa acuminata subsp. burmannicoides]